MAADSVNTFLDGRVLVVVGDITAQDVDAVVNAANSTLLGGGGVDGAIHRVGGSAILEECRKVRRELFPKGLPTGEAVITTGGNLRASYVIHTVGPIYGQDPKNQAAQLSACYHNSLALAEKHSISSIAFPSISTGAFGYPRHEAAAISSLAIKGFLLTNDVLREARLVFFSESDAAMFRKHQQFE